MMTSLNASNKVLVVLFLLFTTSNVSSVTLEPLWERKCASTSVAHLTSSTQSIVVSCGRDIEFLDFFADEPIKTTLPDTIRSIHAEKDMIYALSGDSVHAFSGAGIYLWDKAVGVNMSWIRSGPQGDGGLGGPGYRL